MKKILIILVCVLLLGCSGGNVACPEDAKLCPDGTTLVREGPDCEFPGCPEIEMGLEDALLIAADSECTEEGSLLGTGQYNEVTKTWWLDLELEKEGCNPACVVSVKDKTAEINWRCTGLITP